MKGKIRCTISFSIACLKKRSTKAYNVIFGKYCLLFNVRQEACRNSSRALIFHQEQTACVASGFGQLFSSSIYRTVAEYWQQGRAISQRNTESFTLGIVVLGSFGRQWKPRRIMIIALVCY